MKLSWEAFHQTTPSCDTTRIGLLHDENYLLGSTSKLSKIFHRCWECGAGGEDFQAVRRGSNVHLGSPKTQITPPSTVWHYNMKKQLLLDFDREHFLP